MNCGTFTPLLGLVMVAQTLGILAQLALVVFQPDLGRSGALRFSPIVVGAVISTGLSAIYTASALGAVVAV